MKKIVIPKTAQELVERYCPNYEERKANIADQRAFSGDWRIGIPLQEQMEYEALTAFAEAVAEEQAEIDALRAKYDLFLSREKELDRYVRSLLYLIGESQYENDCFHDTMEEVITDMNKLLNPTEDGK